MAPGPGARTPGRATSISGYSVDTYSRDLEFQVAGFQHELAHALGYEVHTLILTKEKVRDLSRKDAPFYEEFIRDYVVIRGEGIDKA